MFKHCRSVWSCCVLIWHIERGYAFSQGPPSNQEGNVNHPNYSGHQRPLGNSNSWNQILETTGGKTVESNRPETAAISPCTVVAGSRDTHQRFTPSSLIPLSLDPLLFVTQDPLLTPDECQTLADYSRRQAQNSRIEAHENVTPSTARSTHATSFAFAHNGDAVDDSFGEAILNSLKTTLKDLFLLDESSEDVDPRFLEYEPSATIDNHGSSSGTSSLLPDGLHVDTNNGYWFRYLTVLVYLTDANSSGTSFPVAQPLLAGDHCSTDSARLNGNRNNNAVYEAAQTLLDADIHHTGDSTLSNNPQFQDHANTLHEQSWRTYQGHDQQSTRTSPSGIRVLPRKGHVCAFLTLDSNGRPDPASWHGAESLDFGDTKQVLSFFYEIPLDVISSQADMGRQIDQRKQKLTERYCRQHASISMDHC